MPLRPILIVDHDRTSASRIVSTLAALGYHVELAVTSTTALKQARQHDYSLAIVSESLPDGRGVLLFRKMRQLRSGIRGILLTTVGNLATVCDALTAGMHRVLMRPVDFEELLPAVEHVRLTQPPLAGSPPQTSVSRSPDFDVASIASLSSATITDSLSRAELIGIVRSVDYPFAGKERLEGFDRDTLVRLAFLVRRWCISQSCRRA